MYIYRCKYTYKIEGLRCLKYCIKWKRSPTKEWKQKWFSEPECDKCGSTDNKQHQCVGMCTGGGGGAGEDLHPIAASRIEKINFLTAFAAFGSKRYGYGSGQGRGGDPGGD